jgi:hypothetical protein
MTVATTRRLDDLNLELRGLLLTRALLELRGLTPAQLDAHDDRITRVRAELAGLGAAPANEGGNEG